MALGQDTISVYFTNNSAKLEYEEEIKLYELRYLFQSKKVDSIVFIGGADSLGRPRANRRLSEKRANNTLETCRSEIPRDVFIRTIAKGENSHSEQQSRRVDVILYYRPEKNTKEPLSSERCYHIDYHLLETAHVRTVVQRRKSTVIIEVQQSLSMYSKQHFYGIIGKKGKFRTKKLKWKERFTGSSWWRKRRWVTSLPLESYQQFRIFYISNSPCDSCSEDFKKIPAITQAEPQIARDVFLMRNLQTKKIPFRKDWVKIRTPSIYVNLDSQYYYSYGSLINFEWKLKRQRAIKSYCKAKVQSTSLSYAPGIYRNTEMCYASANGLLPNAVDTTNNYRVMLSKAIGSI